VAVQALFDDPACPWTTVLANRGRRSVYVDDFLRFANERSGPQPHIEQAVDSFVERVGGRRVKITDPWASLANVFRRLAGRRPTAATELWELPREIA
jgi:hypothetical protein